MPRRKKQSDLEFVIECFVDVCEAIVFVLKYILKGIYFIGRQFFKSKKIKTSSSRDQSVYPNSYQPPIPKLSKKKEWNIELLNELEWKRFEEVVSEYYTLLGYRSEVTRMGADGGVDVLLYQQGSDTPAIFVQCKSWSQKVGVKAIRELYGVMSADQIEYGVFATTSSYTNEAIEWAVGKRLQLLTGQDFVTAFNQLPDDQRTYLIQFATFEDYSTPTCPSCDQKMVNRTASKGKSAGSSFWGCRNYPKCKQTFKIV